MRIQYPAFARHRCECGATTYHCHSECQASNSVKAQGYFQDTESASSWRQEREAFFDDVHPTTITENRMNNSFFMIRLDGRFHPSIPTCTKSAYCQYCKFKYTHKLDPSVRKKNEWMFNNRGGITMLICVLIVLTIGMG